MRRKLEPKQYFSRMIGSPVGALKLVASDAGLAAILWENEDPRRVRLGHVVKKPDHPVLVETERQLGEYFTGKRKAGGGARGGGGAPGRRRGGAAGRAGPY